MGSALGRDKGALTPQKQEPGLNYNYYILKKRIS
jgi:hypothetical protein